MIEKEESQKKKGISKDLYLLGLKVFWRTISNFKMLLFVILVLAIAFAVTSTWSRFLAGSFIEKLTLDGSEQAVAAALTLVVIGLVNIVITWFSQYNQTKLNAWSQRFYEAELNKKVVRISAEFIKKKNAGGLISIINRGSSAVFNIGAGLLLRLVEPLITGIVAIVSIFAIAPQFGITSLVSVFFYVLVVAVMNPRAVRAQRNFRDTTKEFSEYMHDLIANLFSLKHSSFEKQESYRIASWYENIEEKGDEHRKSWNDMDFWQNLIRVSTEASFRVIGILLIFKTKNIGVGEMVTVMGLYISIFRPVDIIANNWRSVVNSLIDLEASEELYNEPEEDYNESGTTISDNEQLQPLVINQVSFSYPDAPEVPVLKDVTLTINPCEVIALVSTSGGGKSTLFDLLYRLYEPSGGSIKYGDTLISDFKLSDYRKQFAIVPQDISLFNTTLKHNIVYGSEHVTDDQLAKVLRETSMDGFVAKLPEGIETIVGDKGMKLSGGQKQRVAICRAFLRSPKILLMDEPTSALDAETESVIQAALLDLFVGKTVIVAAHRLATIKRADRIVVLKEGGIIEIGTHDELMHKKEGEYKKLYELQVGLY